MSSIALVTIVSSFLASAVEFVEAVTIVPGGGFSPGSEVGAAPSRRLLVPGKAVLWTSAGISTEPV